MEKNQMIILALIVIIAALLVGIVMMPNIAKKDTSVTFKGKSTLTEGDSIKIKLTDVNGNAIAGQTVNITITDKDDSKSYYSVVTDDDGEGKLKLDKDTGTYDVQIKYNGNNNYKECNATKKITIKAKEVEASTTTQSSTPTAYAYRSDGTPMYSQSEVDRYMMQKYGFVNYHIQDNGYINLDEPGYDDAGHRVN